MPDTKEEALKGEIVPRDNVFIEMDRRDEHQIIASLEGEVLKEMAYTVKGKHRLSWAGVKECLRRLGRISFGKPEIIDIVDAEGNVTHYRVLIMATDTLSKVETWAVAQQSVTQTRKDGTVEENPFALPTALSKCQRNAGRQLIPELMIEALITEYLKPANGRKKLAGGEPPKPAAGERAAPAVVDDHAPARIAPDSERGQPPPVEPVTEDQRDAAVATIRNFIKKDQEKNASLVKAMVASQNFNDENWLSPDDLPDEVLAYVVKEINVIEDNMFQSGLDVK